MLKRILNFTRSEEGAVTVDWVVLTAAVVSLAVSTVWALQTGSDAVGTSLGNKLATTAVTD